MYRALSRVLPQSQALSSRISHRLIAHSSYPLCARKEATDATATSGDADEYEEENLLKGKRSRENIHNAFAARAADVLRYEYFAQRADIEAETEAAAMLRSLTEVARQQSMGYLELMEEYGDADFGETTGNLELAADGERANAETVLRENATVAGEEELEQVEEWFEDMAEASDKAAGRLELMGSMMDAEGMGSYEEEEDDSIPKN